REALSRTKKIGIAKVVIRTRQYLCAVEPFREGIMLNLLRYKDEIVSKNEFDLPEKKSSEYKISKKEIDLAEKLIEQMSTEWRPEQYKDDYRTAIMKMIEKKIKHKGRKVVVGGKKRAIKSSTNVIDFVSAIKKSLERKKTTRKRSRTKSKRKYA